MQILKNNLDLISLIKRCRETEDMNIRIGILQSINRLLPTGYEIKMPSFITDDYIDKVLYALEDKITKSYV